TSVIGVVLAGIAVGNYAGGLLADRRAPRPTLALLFVLSSAASVTITVVNQSVGGWMFLWTLPWSARVGLHVAAVFLVPSLLLGMISPVAAKMALDRGRGTGRTIGSVYAWGVAGSIAGTFATGFWLIAAFGTAAVIWAVGAVLASMGLLYGAGARWPAAWAGLFTGLLLLGTGPWAWAVGLGERLDLREPTDPDVIWMDDSEYSRIRVVQVSEQPDIRNLLLDKLHHSTIVMERPYDLQYPYERVYAAATAALGAGRGALNTLTIGGGGYVLPRWIDQRWPGSRTEVVEIDPDVTRAAVEAFGLPADHGFEIAHEDGRAHVRRLVERRKRGEDVPPYDFVYLDVFDDYGVPYQLTTLEFLEQVRELLAPDGAFLMNLIDIYGSGRFLGAMLATMEAVFPRVAVFVEGEAPSARPDVRNTYILVATMQPAELGEMTAAYSRPGALHRLSAEELASVRGRAGGRLLTDDWSPVENLMAPVVKKSAGELAASVLTERARDRLREGDARGALSAARRATELHPASVTARETAALALLETGDRAGAVRALQAAVEERPDLVRLGYRLGVLLTESGDFEAAAAALRNVVARAPEDNEARNELGIALARAGRLEEAVMCFTEVLRRDPSHAKAHSNLEATRALQQQP
ncbi:MAG TPA: fused MFS/spermidine synthase, partial [bacterium]|nr:fused MFS/spermidine synthase [bacterium]